MNPNIKQTSGSYSYNVNYRFGYNNWRDPQKPSMILKQLCKDNKLDPPAYSRGKVVVNGVTFLGEEFVEDEGGKTPY